MGWRIQLKHSEDVFMVGRGKLLASIGFAWFAAGSLFAQTEALKIELESGQARLGQSLTLHVNTPETPSGGRITFFRGVVPLGTGAFNDRGEAILHTNLLSAGEHSIRAVRWGKPASASPA